MKSAIAKTFYVFFFLVLCLMNARVQSQPYYFRHLQVENGLSNNTVYFIRQDSKGFIWAATKDGLNRFDGVHFKVFRIDNKKNKKQPGADYIFCINPRKNGWLWIGSQQGLYQFDPVKERLEPFITSLKNIYDITIDSEGQMWFISSSTVCRYNFTTKKLRQYPPADFFFATTLCLAKTERYGPEPNMDFWKNIIGRQILLFHLIYFPIHRTQPVNGFKKSMVAMTTKFSQALQARASRFLILPLIHTKMC